MSVSTGSPTAEQGAGAGRASIDAALAVSGEEPFGLVGRQRPSWPHENLT
jgi:hypothetical protein